MSKVTAIKEQEEKILRENGMDPSKYGVLQITEDHIRLLCYKTRDIIEIWKGDRSW